MGMTEIYLADIDLPSTGRLSARQPLGAAMLALMVPRSRWMTWRRGNATHPDG